ncbi:MAG TPA: sugar-binding protein, partial [Lacipirellulaceae bacterium]|nr:sugar-binding protein [Lacipirellulaceae bacterium]
IAVIIFVSIVVSGCNRGQEKGSVAAAPGYAFIANGVADFWEYSRAGAKKAGRDLGANVTVITPSSITDQTRKIEDLLTRGTDGIAISPIDPENQVETINKAAAQTNLVTADSDAPHTNRLVYIGMDNYRAGLMCGKTLRDAMPDGGTVMIFIGRLDQDNAKRRRQGFIDALLGRKPDPNRHDPPGGELSSADKKFIILGTMTDQFDRAKAKANVEDTITRYPNISGMVGMFEYNPQMILEALDRLGKLHKVKVMGFDENFATLQGIKDGTVIATIVQNPYQYGYESIRVLNELHKGNKSVIPENKFIEFPARVIDQSNVDSFWKQLKDQLATIGESK